MSFSIASTYVASTSQIATAVLAGVLGKYNAYAVDWATSAATVAGTGATAVDTNGGCSCAVNTGANAGSTARRTSSWGNLGNTTPSTKITNDIDFSKNFIFSFKLNLAATDANGVHYIRLGASANTAADAGGKSIGIHIHNAALKVQTYDTGLTETDCATALTPGTTYNIRLEKISTTVYCYVDDSLVATVTTNVPNDAIGSANNFNISCGNGVTAADYGFTVGCVQILCT